MCGQELIKRRAVHSVADMPLHRFDARTFAHQLPPLPAGLIDRIAWLRERSSVPILVGFGISGPEQAGEVSQVADGVIVGSAVVRQLEAAPSAPAMTQAVEQFVGELVAACEIA